MAKKMRIVIVQKFGPFKSQTEITNAKKYLKQKVSKITFSKPVKSARGYTFNGKITYLKSFEASASVVKSAVQKQVPRAKVTVTTA